MKISRWHRNDKCKGKEVHLLMIITTNKFYLYKRHITVTIFHIISDMQYSLLFYSSVK